MPKFNGMDYLVKGEGRAIVLLHGWGANKDVFKSVIDELSLNYKVYAIDFLGFGKSSQQIESATIYTYARDIKEFILKVVQENVILLGHSFGGRVCLILGQESFVDALILVDSAGIKPRFSLKKYFLVKRYKNLKRKVEANKIGQEVLEKFGSSDYKSLNEAQRRIFIRVVNEDLSAFCAKIDKRTLLLWGKKDKDTPIYMAKTMHKMIKKSELYLLPAGHFCFLDNYTLFMRRLYKFLQEIDYV